MDQYVAHRRTEKGRINDVVSPFTVNKELRILRAALGVAFDWGYITKVPKFRFVKQPEKLPTFIPTEHFAAIYNVCETARSPNDVPNVTPCDWWRGLIVTAYMTGWRISQILALRWEDVDLEDGFALSRAEDNKGKRDVKIPIHKAVVQHLKKLNGSFDTHVFPWNLHERTLWTHFGKIQEASGIPQCGKEGWYGFHDLRRGFATQNAAEMDLFELQNLMQHKSLETTKLYVNMAGSMRKVVDALYVPDVLKSSGLM